MLLITCYIYIYIYLHDVDKILDGTDGLSLRNFLSVSRGIHA